MKCLPLVASVLLLAACGSATDITSSTAATNQTAPTGSKTVIGAYGAYLPGIDNDGTYLVGVDIPAGKYRNAGGARCYWARLRSVDPSDIVDSHETSDPQVIMIRADDTAFLTQNCGIWQMAPFI